MPHLAKAERVSPKLGAVPSLPAPGRQPQVHWAMRRAGPDGNPGSLRLSHAAFRSRRGESGAAG